MTRLDRTNAPHHVYRCFDIDGRLIYVGSTADLFSRLAQHNTSSWWAPTVANVKAEFYPNGVVAREAERRAIRDEVPRWNKSGKWAGRRNWTRDDWHDWIATLLRDGVSPQLKNTVRDYEALFSAPLPADLAAKHADAQQRRAEREAAWEKQRAEQEVARQSRECEELRELNAELSAILARQAALARALGIDWDDPALMDPSADIDAELRRRS